MFNKVKGFFQRRKKEDEQSEQLIIDKRCLKGHSSIIFDVTALPDNKIATTSWDRTIKIWSLDRQTCIQTLHSHKDDIFQIQKFSDNKIISTCRDGSIICHDAKTYQKIFDLKDNVMTRAILVLSDDQLAVGQAGGKQLIKIWDIKKKKPIQNLEGHKDAIYGLLKISDEVIASCSQDKTVKVWSLRTGNCLRTFDGHTKWVNALAKYNEDVIASCSHDNKVIFWNWNNGNNLYGLNAHEGGTLDIKIIGNMLITAGCGDQSVKIWEINYINGVLKCQQVQQLDIECYAWCIEAINETNTLLIGIDNDLLEVVFHQDWWNSIVGEELTKKVEEQKANREEKRLQFEKDQAQVEAEKDKEEGNKLFSAKNYNEAIIRYTEAIDKSTDNVKKSVYFNNRSLCWLRLDNYQKCVDDADKSIQNNNKFFKPYFNKAKALNHLDQVEGALKAIEAGKAQGCSHADIDTLEKQLREQIEGKTKKSEPNEQENEKEIKLDQKETKQDQKETKENKTKESEKENNIPIIEEEKPTQYIRSPKKSDKKENREEKRNTPLMSRKDLISQQLEQKLFGAATCTVCNERQKDCSFQCGHTFCSECAESTKDKTNKCSICEAEITDLRTLIL